MTTLSIWKFATPEGADQALDTLVRLQDRRPITVQDASVVSWPEGRRTPRTRQARDLAAPAALSGAFWGLLFGLVFLLPVAGRVAGTASRGADALTLVGLSGDLLARVRDRITPGTSALFLLTADEVVARVHDAFAGTHAELFQATLGADHETALRAAFDDDEEPVIV